MNAAKETIRAREDSRRAITKAATRAAENEISGKREAKDTERRIHKRAARGKGLQAVNAWKGYVKCMYNFEQNPTYPEYDMVALERSCPGNEMFL